MINKQTLFITIYMILKQYSRLRYSLPRNFYAASKRSAKPQQNNEPISTFKEADKRLSDYLFFKYDVNQQIEEELTELKKSAQLLIKKTKPNIITNMHRILFEIPFETISETNIKILKDIMAVVKAQVANQRTCNLYSKLEEKISALNNSSQNFNCLFRAHRISEDNQKMTRDQRAQIILKHLKQDPLVKLSVEQINSFLQKLCENYVLTPLQQEIRLNLLKRVELMIPELSIKLLSNIGTHLNAISHYDFIPIQLQIVKKIFINMAKRESEMTDGILQQVFKGKQYPSNVFNLSQFYFIIFEKRHKKLKRNNSAQAHKLFQFVGMINSKILPAFYQNQHNSFLQKYRQTQDIKYHQLSLLANPSGQYQYKLYLFGEFIVRYVQLNGKTQKNYKATIDAFMTLLSSGITKHAIMPGLHYWRCNKMMQQCNAGPNASLFYLLAKQGEAFIPYIQANFKDLWKKSIKREKITLALIARMIKIESADQAAQKFINEYFDNVQNFVKLIKQLQIISLSKIIQSFHGTFQDQIHKLLNNIDVNSLRQKDQKYLLKYFIECQSVQQNLLSYQTLDNQSVQVHKEISILKYLFSFPIDIILDNAQIRLKDLSYRQIERYLPIAELLIVKQGSQRKDQMLIDILERINARFRENQLSFDKALVYKRLLQLMTSKCDYYLSKKGSVRPLFTRLINNFITKYNNNFNNQYHLSGFYVTIITNLIQKVTFFDCDIPTKHLIIKEGLYCSILGNKNVHKIGVIDQSYFTFIELQKIKYFGYSKHEIEIKQITHQTLPYIILNRNLHNYLQSHKGIISDLISSANSYQFQNIIRQFCYYSLPLSPPLFDIFLKIMKQLPTKIQLRSIQRHVFFNKFCLKYYFRPEQLEKIVYLWARQFVETPYLLQDFQTHILILKLMKSLKISDQFSTKYLNILLARYSNFPEQQEKIFYHILFLNIYFLNDVSHRSLDNKKVALCLDNKLSRYLTFENPEIILTSLLFLSHEFGEKSLILLKKVMNIAMDRLTKQGKVDFLSYYQYVYLKKTYQKETQNFNIPQECLNKTPFSVETPQAINLLKSIANFLKQPLTKIQLHANSIYKLRSNYIIFLPVDKQSSIHEFQYLRRLMNCLFSDQKQQRNNLRVTIVQKIEYSSYIPYSKTFKLNNLMSNQEWSLYFQMLREEQKRESSGKLNEDKGSENIVVKIARHKLSNAQQMKQTIKNRVNLT